MSSLYHTIRYPKKKTEGYYNSTIKRLKDIGPKLNALVTLEKQPFQKAYSQLEFPQEVELAPLAEAVGNFTRTKFFINQKLIDSEYGLVPFNYMTIVGRGSNAELANRLFHWLCLTIFNELDLRRVEYIKRKRRLRKRGIYVKRRHARSYTSKKKKELIDDITSVLSELLAEYPQTYTKRQELDIVMFIDLNFNMNLKQKKGPKKTSEPTIAQYHGKGIKQLINKWPTL